MTATVLCLIDTDTNSNEVSVYESSEPLTGDLKVYDEDGLYTALRRFLLVIGWADLAQAAVLDLRALAQAISDHHGAGLSRPRWRWPW